MSTTIDKYVANWAAQRKEVLRQMQEVGPENLRSLVEKRKRIGNELYQDIRDTVDKQFKQLELTEKELLDKVWGFNNFLYNGIKGYENRPNQFIMGRTMNIRDPNPTMYVKTSDDCVYSLFITPQGVRVESCADGEDKANETRNKITTVYSEIERLEAMTDEEKTKHESHMKVLTEIRDGFENMILAFSGKAVYQK